MKSILATALLVAGTDALVSRRDSCCFHLSSAKGPEGTVGQLHSGLNRIGQDGLTDGIYCIDSWGGITDGEGRSCILNPGTTRFQCEDGVRPTTGFSVNCNGYLEHDDSKQFAACPTRNGAGYNIFTESVRSTCIGLTLVADACYPACSRSALSAPSCPLDTANADSFVSPSVIVPISDLAPDTAYGASVDGKMQKHVSTIFNFKVPLADLGKQCTLIFRLPKVVDLPQSTYTYSGIGGIDFSMLDSPATDTTTYNNAPGLKEYYGTVDVQRGGAYAVATFNCPAGETVAFEAKTTTDEGTFLTYFQSSIDPSIGAFITVC